MAKKFYLISSFVSNRFGDFDYPVFNYDNLQKVKGEGFRIKKEISERDQTHMSDILRLEIDKQLKEKIRHFIEDCLDRKSNYSSERNTLLLYNLKVRIRDLVKDYNTLREYEEYQINRKILFKKLKRFYGYIIIGGMLGYFMVKIAQKILELTN
jgi:hypothetical protein